MKEVIKEIVDFSGIWQREDEALISTIIIDQEGEEIKFNWKQEPKDGSWIIECNDQGECDKVQNGEKIEHYSFSIRLSEDKKKLLVQWIAKRLNSSEVALFVDEIQMLEGGKEIMSRPIAYDREGNKVYKGEEYRFLKVED